MLELCVLLLTPIESLQIMVASSDVKKKNLGSNQFGNVPVDWPRQRDKHPSALTPNQSLKLPVSLMCMLLDGGRNLGRHCADTRSLFTDHDDQFPHSLSKHAAWHIPKKKTVNQFTHGYSKSQLGRNTPSENTFASNWTITCAQSMLQHFLTALPELQRHCPTVITYQQWRHAAASWC